jgi:pantoate--beta-alanine ligase
MDIITDLANWQVLRRKLAAHSVGFVHTMGNLHAGHLSLCTRSQGENDITVVAIFINPTQFNEPEDFARYPRTLAQDQALLLQQKIDYLLLFDEQTIYPHGYRLKVHEVSELGQILEAQYRPGHFAGMLTVVLKYLHIVKPTRAYYGEKDYQQLLLIQHMARELFLETEIIGCPTVRAEDGLALSSRNSRLTQEQRQKARRFPEILHSGKTITAMVQELQQLNFKVDYVLERWGRRLAAVWLDSVRLIDNIPIS